MPQQSCPHWPFVHAAAVSPANQHWQVPSRVAVRDGRSLSEALTAGSSIIVITQPIQALTR